MKGRERHAVLGGDANHETTRPLRLRIRIHIIVEDDQKVDIAVRTGLSPCLRAIDDEPFEPVPIELFKRLLGVLQRVSNRIRKSHRGGHDADASIKEEDGQGSFVSIQ
jgi:hypothetical protein